MMISSQRVANRYLIKRAQRLAPPGGYSKAILDALPAYILEDTKPMEDAANGALQLFGFREGFGGGGTITADWYYALAPAGQNRATKTLRGLLGLLHPQSWGVEKYFTALAADVKWVEGRVKGGEGGEFEHGPWKVTLMKGVSRAVAQVALDSLDAATDHLSQRFHWLVYGKLFISSGMGSAIGRYVSNNDTVMLSARALRGTRTDEVLLHELGHRYFQKKGLPRELRNTLWSFNDSVYEDLTYTDQMKNEWADFMIQQMPAKLKGTAPMPFPKELGRYLDLMRADGSFTALRTAMQAAMKGGPAEEQKLRQVFLANGPSSRKTDKLVRGPIYVTEYGKKNAEENFCEGFAQYNLKMPLPPEVQELMEALP